MNTLLKQRNDDMEINVSCHGGLCSVTKPTYSAHQCDKLHKFHICNIYCSTHFSYLCFHFIPRIYFFTASRAKTASWKGNVIVLVMTCMPLYRNGLFDMNVQHKCWITNHTHPLQAAQRYGKLRNAEWNCLWIFTA